MRQKLVIAGAFHSPKVVIVDEKDEYIEMNQKIASKLSDFILENEDKWGFENLAEHLSNSNATKSYTISSV